MRRRAVETAENYVLETNNTPCEYLSRLQGPYDRCVGQRGDVPAVSQVLLLMNRIFKPGSGRMAFHTSFDGVCVCCFQ